MPTILLHTEIAAPIERCFDLSRSIDLHKLSTAQTQEEAIDGVMSGLIGLGQSVTWQAVHFGVRQTLSTQITACDSPAFFVDEMTEGAFHSFRHEHHFESTDTGTMMTDRFIYQSPLGLLDKLADWLILKRYMTKLLYTRNQSIKHFAESDQWQLILE